MKIHDFENDIAMTWEVDDVVQVEPTVQRHGGCFGIIVEVKNWGVVVEFPRLQTQTNLKYGDFEKVGTAVWVPPQRV